MENRRYMKLFGWMAAAVLLLTTSCKDNLFEGSNGMSDEVTVSFTLAPEAAAMSTRADNGYVTYPADGLGHISDGSKADMLIYAVYSKGDLLEEYRDNTAAELQELKNLGITPGFGQTIKLLKEGECFPTTINLTLKRGEEYTIAFWAQSRKTKAYNTSDLRKVEVIYSVVADEIKEQESDDPDNPTTVDDDNTTSGGSNTKSSTPNNDEFRDVFCRSVNVKIESNSLTQNVYLYRPLAQINIGTSGYDFEMATRGSDIHQYKYSKVRINRVARYLDVVEDKTITSTTKTDGTKTPESFAVVDFGYAPIPAYVNYRGENDEYKDEDLPNDVSHTVWDWIYNDDTAGLEEINYLKEEFLRVKLFNKDKEKPDIEKEWTTDKYDPYDYREKSEGEIKDGFRDYANVSRNDLMSETFKYLSMSYVLTSSTNDAPIVINNVKMWLATDENGTNETQVLDINHVPAQRNWRTNIIGNLLTANQTFEVVIDRDFAGEYNGWVKDGEWAYLSGPLADGVYYDAAANNGEGEIQISNANGLLWLQRMVNGDIYVRDKAYDKAYGEDKVGKERLKYYDESGDGKSHDFNYDGYKYDDYKDDPQLLERILAATHYIGSDGKPIVTNYQTYGDNKYWPKNNNFNFYGAKIKLMADIDLADIDWVPIGFDVAIHDNTIIKGKPYDVNMSYCDIKYTEGDRRMFCGTFDGNHHTIKNLKTFRVGAKVHDNSLQVGQWGPYDNFQWYPYGLFGIVVDYGTIKNVRLQNVDIKGYECSGALVGIVFNGQETGKESTDVTEIPWKGQGKAEIAGNISITNCYVDGGSVTLSPMYRGESWDNKTRSFARGVFCGGLVGNIVINTNSSTKFSLTDCDVRNLTLRAYRQVGGLVGGISNHENYMETKDPKGFWDWNNENFDLEIRDNTISNVLVICNQFQAFEKLANIWEGDKDASKKEINGTQTWKNGFGWSSSYRSLAGPVVGGIYNDKDLLAKYNANNSYNLHSDSVTVTEFKTSREAAGSTSEVTFRSANIGSVPLHELPMLSSWFCDTITLNANYYGQPSAYVKLNEHDFAPESTNESTTFKVPFKLPYNLAPDYVTNSSRAGVYVESVILDGNGKESIGGRSVITPEGITKSGDCAMYVTARNRKQFYEKLDDSHVKEEDCKKPTIIKNVVLRGAPNYAWAGLRIDPDKENMSYVKLDNVAIYDVHRTITQDPKTSGTDANGVELKVTGSNLRGYTVPGKGWKQITYTGTTFEQGSTTGAESNVNEAMTCKVESKTTFENCYFKAPYIIDLEVENLNDVTFTNSRATSATSGKYEEIKLKNGCKYITITSNAQGDPIVTYYDANRKNMDDPATARRR